jgi:hypothetical protein
LFYTRFTPALHLVVLARSGGSDDRLSSSAATAAMSALLCLLQVRSGVNQV